MAHLNWHGKIVEVWQSRKHENTRYHVTETGRVLVTYGPRNGKAKVMRINEKGMSTREGKFAHVDNLRHWLDDVATKQ